MTTPPSSSGSSDIPNATRQMLDELDALMERMLALPVSDVESELLPQSRTGRRQLVGTSTQPTSTALGDPWKLGV